MTYGIRQSDTNVTILTFHALLPPLSTLPLLLLLLSFQIGGLAEMDTKWAAWKPTYTLQRRAFHT